MTDQGERYDRIAAGYAQWWAPVLEARAPQLLDRVEDAVRAGARRLIDVGTGTGTLARAAIGRWPAVDVVGIDISAGMAAAADAEADRLIGADDRHRFETRVAPADRLPFEDGTFDVAVSSFVLQLVPNRFRALREARRVLRPGGVFGWVSWLAGGFHWLPDDDFDDALGDVDEEPRDWDDRPGDLRDPAAAAAQMRRAGFAEVTARADRLLHPFDVESALGFLTEFDEEDLVASLGPERRPRFEAGLRRRLSSRPQRELALDNRTVTVRGIRR